MDKDDIINYLGKIGTNGSSEAISLIERQAEAIRVLRGELKVGVALHGVGTSSEWEASAREAIAQTKEFGEVVMTCNNCKNGPANAGCGECSHRQLSSDYRKHWRPIDD